MYVLLAIIGAAIGALINACVYSLGEKKSAISPWITASQQTARTWIHRLPVIGWLNRDAEASELGKRFWLRPLFIELTWIIGLPFFYFWIFSDGLTGGVAAPANWHFPWFVGHSTLFAFLFVATFIDFDQRIIPDSITLPGTLIALLLAALWPSFRLPQLVPGLVGMKVESVDFADGAALPTWHMGSTGLLIAIAIYLIWIVALLPKYPLTELNCIGLKRVWVSTIRLLQYNGLKVRAKTRRLGWMYLGIGMLGAILIAVAWTWMTPQYWNSLFGAVVGLGLGGISIWLVRIVASHSLGQEAMGFGDVTLMAMIGAFLGWQAALITFAVSPFAALAIVLVCFLITKENELAFGPYLCAGAMITIFWWSSIWPKMLLQFFISPMILLGVLSFSLVLLMVMMLGIRMVKAGASGSHS